MLLNKQTIFILWHELWICKKVFQASNILATVMNTQSSHNGSFLIQNSVNLINNFIRVTGNLTGSLCLPN